MNTKTRNSRGPQGSASLDGIRVRPMSSRRQGLRDNEVPSFENMSRGLLRDMNAVEDPT